MAVWVSCFVFPLVIIGVIFQFIHGLIRKYVFPIQEDQERTNEKSDDSRTTEETQENHMEENKLKSD